MANIWKINRDVTQHPNRNNFDLSFQSHSTFKFGYLYPVFCRRVVPGDSFRIDSAFDLKMMPISFPIQSRVRAHMHFFYCRNKNLWKNWEDWISGLKSNDVCPHPYLDVKDSDIKTGSIHDFLNQPTTVSTKQDITSSLGVYNPIGSNSDINLRRILFRSVLSGGRVSSVSASDIAYPVVFFNSFDYSLTDSHVRFNDSAISLFNYIIESFKDPEIFNFGNLTSIDLIAVTDLNIPQDFSSEPLVTSFDGIIGSNIGVDHTVLADYTLPDSFLSAVNSAIALGKKVHLGVSFSFVSYQSNVKDIFDNSSPSRYQVTLGSETGVFDWSDLNLPFYKDKIVPLNALKYRAYESIYRAFYASDIWQPLVIDGQKEYNKFITNDGDGADSTDYHLFKRNYELDFLTSALPSPQAGPAPLVGISALGDVTIEDENGITTGKAVLDENDNITKIAITSPLASVEHGRTAANIAMLGMNINDFRSANSLQRLLEQTMRSGYRYMKFIKGHFDVEPGYKELDMPEFLGGFSRNVEFGTVISQSDTAGIAPDAGKNLGDFSGIGRVVGGSNHSITHYCDDYGWIMGIMCITPTPAYSQLLPKENICPTNYLDYYFPEMSQVGMQPIPYSEVAPLQAYLDNLADPDKRLTDTFGYQRPNYDMVGSVDEVHGLFRTDLKDMLINRVFDGRPELGSDFLQIDPSEINDIFINRNPDEDVFIGHLAFKVTPKRPLPRVHIAGIK